MEDVLKFKLELDTDKANMKIDKFAQDASDKVKEIADAAKEADTSEGIKETLEPLKGYIDDIRSKIQSMFKDFEKLGPLSTASDEDLKKMSDITLAIKDYESILGESERLYNAIIDKTKMVLSYEQKITQEKQKQNAEANGNTEPKAQNDNDGGNQSSSKWIEMFQRYSDKYGGITNNIKQGAVKIRDTFVSMLKSSVKSLGGLVSKLRDFGKHAKDSAQSSIASFKRIGLAMLGVGGVINTIKKAMSDYLASNEDTANKINSLWATLGNAIGPVVDWIADKIMSLINLFAGLMKVLFGINIGIKKTTKSAGGQAKAMEDLAEATKEENRQLASFDEMNKLQAETPENKTNNSDSGAGGGGSGFEITQSTWKPWEELQKAIDEGDWVKVGEELARKLNEQIDAIPFAELGAKLGKGLDKIFKISYGFLKELDTRTLGEGIATFFNNTFNNFDPWYVGGSLAQMINRVFDLIGGFVDTFDWSTFGTKLAIAIKGFIENIDLSIIVGAIEGLISGLWDSAIAFFQELNGTWGLDFQPLIDALQAVKDFIGPIWEDLKTNFGEILQPLAQFLIDALGYGIQFIIGLLENPIFNAILTGLATAIGTISAVVAIVETLTAVITGVKLAFSLLTSPIGLVTLAITALIAIVVLCIQHWDEIKAAGAKAWEGIKNAWEVASEWFSTNISEPIKRAFEGVWTKISSVFNDAKDLGDKVGTSISGAFETAYTAITNAWSGFTDFFSGIWNGLKDVVRNALNAVIGIANRLSFTVPSWVPGIGGEHFGFNIPMLAQGGIAVRPTMAIMGEAGREAVLPLDNNTEWMDALASKVAKVIQLEGTPVVINLDGKTLAKSNIEWSKKLGFNFNG